MADSDLVDDVKIYCEDGKIEIVDNKRDVLERLIKRDDCTDEEYINGLKDYINKQPDQNFYSYVDIALEEGKEDFVKFLVMNFKDAAAYSLYAKQMAMINGHIKLALWVEKFGVLRNKIDIHKVHYNYETRSWASCIPKSYQYTAT